MSRYGDWLPYVSVAERKKQAAKQLRKLQKKGQDLSPITITGKTITSTFWGSAWCKNIEIYQDYAYRLARGRNYVRHGAVLDLKIDKGIVTALVNGALPYKVKITIDKVAKNKWNTIISKCSGEIDSLIELLQGNFSSAVMKIITHPQLGLFPHPKEIKFNCSCPDTARMCKHIAAVFYGIGARIDANPEELFLLRQADHLSLLSTASATSLINKQTDTPLAESELSELFDIDLIDTEVKPKVKRKVKRVKKSLRAKKLIK